MTAAPDDLRTELLVLARLHTTAKKPPGPGEVRTALAQLAGPNVSRSETEERFEGAAARLEAGGAITTAPLRLTDAGRARLRDELGLSEPRPWRQIKASILPALGLGLDPGDHKLVRRLGRADELRKLVAALATRARGTDADAVRVALTRSWLLGQAPLAPARAPSTSARAAASAAPARSRDGDGAAPESSLARFADVIVRHAAAADGDARFGDRKVFIAAVWDRARGDPQLAGLGEGGFKARLVEAHRAGLLTLHRADLVPAMDPAKVQASETRYLNATFHFVDPHFPRTT